MSAAELLDATTTSPAETTQIVNARPTQAARMVQLAIQQGRSEDAMRVLAVMRDAMLANGGTGAQSELLFRGALGLEGSGETMVKTAIGAFLVQRDQMVNAALPVDLRPGGPYAIDSKPARLRHAGEDPGWGRLYARFYDDPAAAAHQLHEEALNDPSAFVRHADQLAEMLRESPARARYFVKAVIDLRKPGSIAVKRWVVAEMHEALTPDLSMAARGFNDGKAGGPVVRAERLIPLLADLVSTPEIAHSLVSIADERVGIDLPRSLPSLRALLDTVLRHSWSQATRGHVRNAITSGAAEMFQDSLTNGTPETQAANATRTAAYIATAAQSEAAVGVVIGVNYFCRLATTILAGPTCGSRGVDLGGVVVVAG